MSMRKLLSVILPSMVMAGAIASSATAFTFKPIGTYSTGIFDDSAAEIPAYDAASQRLFVTNAATNSIDVLSLSDPTAPTLINSINVGGGINSVAFQNGILAAAIENANKQLPGQVSFFDIDGALLNSVTVGALPDMLTFTPDGNKVLVANEGEPNDAYTVDPEGSVSIIDISGGIGSASATTARFNTFLPGDLNDSVRIFGPGASIAQDLEPEYIAVSENSDKAWVALQENNAIAILDLLTGEFTDVVGLGFKDLSDPANALDVSNKDGAIQFSTFDNLYGMFQPDAIAAYTAASKTYIVTANEGDSRDYDGFSEEARVKDLDLDPTAFPDAASLQEDDVLGRLKVTTTLGDTDGDGDYDELYAFGGRSFSIFDEDGNLVFDSGDEFERIIAEQIPDFFNATNDENEFDDRSDDKGPEPEGVTIGKIGGQTLAFIGLERIGGFMVYDITDPLSPFFLEYVNNRDFSGDPEAGTAGDLGPEGLLFVDAKDSPNGRAMLVVTNEVSGSTTVYSAVPEPGTALGLLLVSGAAWINRKRLRRVAR